MLAPTQVLNVCIQNTLLGLRPLEKILTHHRTPKPFKRENTKLRTYSAMRTEKALSTRR